MMKGPVWSEVEAVRQLVAALPDPCFASLYKGVLASQLHMMSWTGRVADEIEPADLFRAIEFGKKLLPVTWAPHGGVPQELLSAVTAVTAVMLRAYPECRVDAPREVREVEHQTEVDAPRGVPTDIASAAASLLADLGFVVKGYRDQGPDSTALQTLVTHILRHAEAIPVLREVFFDAAVRSGKCDPFALTSGPMRVWADIVRSAWPWDAGVAARAFGVADALRCFRVQQLSASLQHVGIDVVQTMLPARAKVFSLQAMDGTSRDVAVIDGSIFFDRALFERRGSVLLDARREAALAAVQEEYGESQSGRMLTHKQGSVRMDA